MISLERVKSGQVRSLGIAWGGALLIIGCGAGSAPSKSPEKSRETSAAQRNAPPSETATNSEEKPEPGPCPDAPDPSSVMAAAVVVSEYARKADDYLKQLGTPPAPPPPYSVARAQEWREKSAQPWFDAQLKRIAEVEQAVESFPEGTYARARGTVIIAGVLDYLKKRKAPIPKYAEKNYEVRVAYLGDFARHGEASLSEVAEFWRKRARKAASEWGMFEIGVGRPWLTADVGHFLREPFPAAAERGDATPLLPASVAVEVSSPGFPASSNEVLELGLYGLTPRQLKCAERYVSEPGVAHVLGRYYTTRALLFRDELAARRAEELLAREVSPAATIDRALLRWLSDADATESHTFDAAEVKSWFDSLPSGDLSRTRLSLNILRGYGRRPDVTDLGPAVDQLPPAERPKAVRTVEGTVALGPPEQTFPWWIPPRGPAGGGGLQRIEGIQMDLSDGSYVIIPYSDEGLDTCSMVHVALDGQRTPHRPPDVKKKCLIRWREQGE